MNLKLDAANADLLEAALTRLGTRVHSGNARALAEHIVKTGEVRFVGVDDDVARDRVAQIKRAYAEEAVKAAAKRNGWAFTQNKKTGQVTLTKKAW